MGPQPFPYAVNFRGFWACPCLAAWIPWYEKYLQHIGVLRPGEQITIYQLIGDAAASGNTHHDGGAEDDACTSPAAILAARQMGCAKWHRPYNWNGKGGMEHGHGVLNNCPHNAPARYQIADLLADYNGLGYLGHAAPDNGPRTPNVFPLRTWQQGIEWAKAQMEAPMNDVITGVDSALGFRAHLWTVADCDAFIAKVKASGNTVLWIYLSRLKNDPAIVAKYGDKCMPPWAVKRCVNAGLVATPIYEDDQTNPTRGAAQGHADAAEAIRQAQAISSDKNIVLWAAYDSPGFTFKPGTPELAHAQAFKADITKAGYLAAGGYGNRAMVNAKVFAFTHLVETWTTEAEGVSGVNVIQLVNEPIIRWIDNSFDINRIVHGFRCWTKASFAAPPPPAAPAYTSDVKNAITSLVYASRKTIPNSPAWSQIRAAANQLTKLISQ